MGRFASDTSVSVAKSRAEIEEIITRYGGKDFVSGVIDSQSVAVLGFSANERHLKFVLPLPSKTSKEFWYTAAKNLRRPESDAMRLWEQACRQRWRALCLCIKAKLEAVDCKITTFEEEFLAHIVLPGGRTVGEEIAPKIALAYETQQVRGLLPDYSQPAQADVIDVAARRSR